MREFLSGPACRTRREGEVHVALGHVRLPLQCLKGLGCLRVGELLIQVIPSWTEGELALSELRHCGTGLPQSHLGPVAEQ